MSDDVALNPDIQMSSMSPTTGLANDVRTAFDRALLNDGKVSDAVLALPGMSGRKYRLFINNLIGLMSDPRYLEIGVWQGSTLCSAIFQNEVTATAIDNWSQFNGPVARFRSNLAKFKGKAKVNVLERDFRDVSFDSLGKFNVYLFDGPHSYKDQYDGLTLAKPALDEIFILIVDDWNWNRVRVGTFDAIRDSGYHIDYSIELRTSLDGTTPLLRGYKSDWHNGYFIAVMTVPA